MATIFITRDLDPLIGVFNINTFDFYVTTGVVPTVTIDGVDFMPVKTGTGGGVDNYTMDVTDILKFVIGLPNMYYSSLSTPYTLELIKSVTISITATGATTITLTKTLSYIISKLGSDSLTDSVMNVYTKGRREKQFYYDKIWFYNSGAAGTYAALINGVSKNYTLYEGWNLITLTTTHLISGTFTIASLGIEFDVYYLGETPTTLSLVSWLNRDGCWSKIYLRKLYENYVVEKSNSIPLYNAEQSLTRAMNRSISANKIVNINFDTIAKNTDHYRLLCEIADSPVVLIDNKILATVTNISQDIAECKQNLHFVLTLQYQDYVANY